MNNIANIINFVRAVEPRVEDDSYLLPTLKNELELCRRHDFRSTVLLQYDALISEDYRVLLNEYADETEKGLWFEVVKPLCEACGIEWRGRYPWDWHNDVGFLIGYEPEDRKKLIDEAFERYKYYFGAYPEVAGSWHIDAFSLAYMTEKYNIKAACICKEQSGTDGYTLWGGFFNGVYYPCKNNMISPAVSKENQINVPVFRMLGSDPIYQYDLGLGDPEKGQAVATLEPVYGNAGADKKWVEWFLDESFGEKSLSVSYTQFGQENSFGWDKIGRGLSMQFDILERKIADGRINLMTLGEAGKLFSSLYSVTPPQTVCADSDIRMNGYKTAWYQCRKYRVDFLYQSGSFRLRDLYLYEDAYKENYLSKRVNGHNCGYYALPVTDGFRFSKGGTVAGIYVCGADCGDYRSSTDENGTVTITAGNVRATADEDGIEINLPDGAYLRFEYSKECRVPYIRAEKKELFMSAKEFPDAPEYSYSLKLNKGFFTDLGGHIDIFPENNIIKIII